MKVLFIGGTGNISAAVSNLALKNNVELFHLNRGIQNRINGVETIVADINDVVKVKQLIKEHTWDVVVDWIAFTPADIERDYLLFKGKTKQYVFISSASAYQKPAVNYLITESTPLKNPFWQYSRDKIACEDVLMRYYREADFPVTIVRPSHTYNTVIPVPMGGWKQYTIIERMKQQKTIVVHGDGTSLWTLTHAEDFALGFLGLLGNTHAIGETFHITSDEVFTWDSIYQHIAEAIGAQVKLAHVSTDKICALIEEKKVPFDGDSLKGDKSHCAVFDNAKIKRFVPQFRTSIPFSTGIKRTLQWFDANPERKIIDKSIDVFFDALLSE